MSKAVYEGLKVLDFTCNMAGPSGAALLADFGAEVIHVERPVTGDDTHAFGPFFGGESFQFQWLNRGKKSIAIDLGDPRGQEIIKKMLPDIDIVMESYRPGIMKKFGLDYEEMVKIKPDLIYCSVSAYGQTGPMAKKPGYDLLAQALSGIIEITGEPGRPPQKSGVVLGDVMGGMNAYMAIATALYHKAITGEGQYIDVSLYEGLVSANAAVDSINHNLPARRTGNHHPILCPYGIFMGNNGESAVICAPNDKLWATLCTLMGHEECINDPELNNGLKRVKNINRIVELIETYVKSFDSVDKAVEVMDAAGIPCCKICNPKEVLHDEHLIQRGSVIDLIPNQKVIDGGKKTLRVRGPWLKLSKTPQNMTQPPYLGQHNHEVLDKYIGAEEVEKIENEWNEKYKR